MSRARLKTDPLAPFKEQLRTGKRFSPQTERRIRNRLQARSARRGRTALMRREFIELLEMPGGEGARHAEHARSRRSQAHLPRPSTGSRASRNTISTTSTRRTSTVCRRSRTSMSSSSTKGGSCRGSTTRSPRERSSCSPRSSTTSGAQWCADTPARGAHGGTAAPRVPRFRAASRSLRPSFHS